ncbi:GNAT family N-acetyltransferase [Pseudomonas sp. RA_35y_Pfl2_P32]|uniref:GNAT family N-acetyltransferase n=1 Tax=Pseudomonas sp. RA_35y_Pfl2_P32 TaxID=3088705 RepID=UPI0030D947CD
MLIRLTHTHDWKLLKHTRLAALLDAPSAFGVSYQSAAQSSDEQWQERADSTSGTTFWLALEDDRALGMIGAALSDQGRYNLIGMWVDASARGSGIASQLVDAVKTRALEQSHGRVFLDVAPDNRRAANFYLKQGFVFIDEWEPLASHPQILVQTMIWQASH